MSDSKRNGNVTVTLRIPVDIYSQIEAVAKDYDVSISAAFRIFLKHTQVPQTPQLSTNVGEANSSVTQQTQQNPVTMGEANSSVTQQDAKKEALRRAASKWNDEE